MSERPTKDEIAKWFVANKMGESPTSIARRSPGHRSHHTVIKALNQIDWSDPILQGLIEKIKGTELDELETIGGMARTVIFNYLTDVLDGNKEPNPISITAIQDRCFQQKRLLLGESTENITLSQKLSEIHEAICSSGRAIGEDLKFLEETPNGEESNEIDSSNQTEDSPVDSQGKG